MSPNAITQLRVAYKITDTRQYRSEPAYALRCVDSCREAITVAGLAVKNGDDLTEAREGLQTALDNVLYNQRKRWRNHYLPACLMTAERAIRMSIQAVA